jgi:hypothetical protein
MVRGSKRPSYGTMAHPDEILNQAHVKFFMGRQWWEYAWQPAG